MPETDPQRGNPGRPSSPNPNQPKNPDIGPNRDVNFPGSTPQREVGTGGGKPEVGQPDVNRPGGGGGRH